MGDDVAVKARLSELHAVALTLFGEARNEPIAGVIAVANVIENRAKHSGFGRKTEVHKRAQFSCWSPAGGPAEQHNHAVVMAAAAELLAGVKVSAPGYARCQTVADVLLADALTDLTGGARHYCTTALLKVAPPTWAMGRTASVVIGAHSFFVGVA